MHVPLSLACMSAGCGDSAGGGNGVVVCGSIILGCFRCDGGGYFLNVLGAFDAAIPILHQCK